MSECTAVQAEESALVLGSVKEALEVIVEKVEALRLNLVMKHLAAGILGHVEADGVTPCEHAGLTGS